MFFHQKPPQQGKNNKIKIVKQQALTTNHQKTSKYKKKQKIKNRNNFQPTQKKKTIKFCKPQK